MISYLVVSVLAAAGTYLLAGFLLGRLPGLVAVLCRRAPTVVSNMSTRQWLHQQGSRARRDSDFQLKPNTMDGGQVPWPKPDEGLPPIHLGTKSATYRWPATGLLQEAVHVTATTHEGRIRFESRRFRLASLMIPLFGLGALGLVVTGALQTASPALYLIVGIPAVTSLALVAFVVWGRFRAEVPLILSDLFVEHVDVPGRDREPDAAAAEWTTRPSWMPEPKAKAS